MPKFAANISWLFTELPFVERFARAREAGFTGVECLFPYEVPLAELCDAQRQSGLPVVLINAPPGDWARGARGLAAQPDCDEAFIDAILLAREYASALGCRQVHVMAGHRVNSLSEQQQYQLLIQRLRQAANLLAEKNISVLIEPLNKEDMPGYFVNSFPLAEKIIHDVGCDNIGLQFDIYHCQKLHGNIINNIQRYLPITRHYQVASSPGRNEPGSGELNDDWIFSQIDNTNYHGWVGCEYQPLTPPGADIHWLAPYK